MSENEKETPISFPLAKKSRWEFFKCSMTNHHWSVKSKSPIVLEETTQNRNIDLKDIVGFMVVQTCDDCGATRPVGVFIDPPAAIPGQIER